MKEEAGSSQIPLTSKSPQEMQITSGEKQILINMYKYRTATDQIQHTDLIEAIAGESGISVSVVNETISEYNGRSSIGFPNKKKIRLSKFPQLTEEQKALIRHKIHEIWIKKELPDLQKILNIIDEDETLPEYNETRLRKTLTQMGFAFSVSSKKSAVMEKASIIAWRQRYIGAIRQYRKEGRPIYFLDETCVNVVGYRRQPVKSTNCSKEKRITMGTSDPTGRVECVIVFHIGSEDGFLPEGLLSIECKKNSGDWQDEISSETFFEWFIKIEPMLKDNAVIVLDAVPYHSKKLDLQPKSSWSKERISEWLKSNGHDVPNNYVKATLLRIAQRNSQEEQCMVDEYARKRGKTILRIPPHHSRLNPIEFAWPIIKKHAMANIAKRIDVNSCLEEGINKVTPQSWKNFIARSIKLENKLMEMDLHMEQTVDWSEYSGSDSSDECPF